MGETLGGLFSGAAGAATAAPDIPVAAGMPTSFPVGAASAASGWGQYVPSAQTSQDALKAIMALSGGNRAPGVQLANPPAMPKLGRGQPMTPTSKSIPPIKAGGASGGGADILRLLAMLTQGRR